MAMSSNTAKKIALVLGRLIGCAKKWEGFSYDLL
jgi:hypothetical protein